MKNSKIDSNFISKPKPHVCKSNRPENMDSSQSFPTSGRLKPNTDLSLSRLLKLIPQGENPMYSYLLSTLKIVKNNYVQEGCAPNLQGDNITLCTCKHFMRSFNSINEWPEYWIAGMKYPNHLFYLMKVKVAYPSMFDIWNGLNERTRNIKSTLNNRYGDIYEPRRNNLRDLEKFDARNYRNSEFHVHADNWVCDINYSYFNGTKRPVYLVGDPNLSFIWTKPSITVNHPEELQFTTGQKRWQLNEFLNQLS